MLSQEPAEPPRDRESLFFFSLFPLTLLTLPIFGAHLASRWNSSILTSNITTAISIQNYIDPGAGLKHLEDWVQDSDFIFDSLFMNSTGPVGGNGYGPNAAGHERACPAVPMVRTYQSDAAM